MVVWQEVCHVCIGVPTDIKGRTVDHYKGLGGVFVVSQDPGGERRLEPDLAYNRRRNECLVVWEQENGNDEIMARRVNAGGTPLFPPSIPISVNVDAEHSPAVGAVPAAPEGHYLVVWERDYNDSGDMDIRRRAVAGDGTPAPSIFSLAFEGVDETQPAVAGNERSNRFLVAWTKDMGSGWTNIYAVEADTSGWRLDTAQSCGFSQGNAHRLEPRSRVCLGRTAPWATTWSCTAMHPLCPKRRSMAASGVSASSCRPRCETLTNVESARGALDSMP
jgi:hypothetical protein